MENVITLPEKEEAEAKFAEVAPGYNLEYARRILLALMSKGPMYEGTVAASVKEKRRDRNRAAKQSRRHNR